MHTTAHCLLLIFIAVAGYCQNCDSGSYFDGNQCAPCDHACATCMSQTICTVCQGQAYLTINNGGLTCQWCSILIPGCAICASESSCSICTEGFSLENNVCVYGSNNGGQVTLSYTQVTCQSYEVNINGACHPSIALCRNYKPDATCDQC